MHTVFALLCFCCGYTSTDFPISIRLTSLALWQSNDCPSASKATLMNMDAYLMWIHYERLHNHNKAKHNKTVCIFLGVYCKSPSITEHGWAIKSSEQWDAITHPPLSQINPDSKAQGANTGPFWGRQDPDGPYYGPMNITIRELPSSYASLDNCIS